MGCLGVRRRAADALDVSGGLPWQPRGRRLNVHKVQSSENLVNKTLEGLGCVSEAKGHSQEFRIGRKA